MEVLRWEVWGNPCVWRGRGSRGGRRESFEVETWEGEAAWLPVKSLLKDQPGEQKIVSVTHCSTGSVAGRGLEKTEREAAGREQYSLVMALGIVLTLLASISQHQG